MKVGLPQMLQGRTKILSTISLMALVLVSAGLQNISQKNGKILILQEGIQTCFSRVHNSYTARLLGSGANYLQDSFVGKTEECFGEAVRLYEELGLENGTILDDLNALSNDVSWFHQKIQAKNVDGLFEGNPENVLLSSIGGRYEKLEIKRDSIGEGLEAARAALKSQKGVLGTIFYGVAAIIPFLLAFDFFSRRSSEAELEDVEKEASELLKSERFSFDLLTPLISRTLKAMGLKSLAQYYELTMSRSTLEAIESGKGEISGNNSEDKSGVQVLAANDRVKRAEQVERLWTEPEAAPKQKKPSRPRKSLNLEESLMSVIDLVSPKIFTSGIKLDTQTETIQVYGEKEPVEQAFYHLLVNAIDNYDFDDPKKFLSINTRKLGNTVLLDFFDSGREFSREFLRQAKGLATGMVEHTDLAIAQSLIEETGQKISFENVADAKGKHLGRKVQVVLEAVGEKKESIPKRRLARLEKSTKKELLAKMKEV